MNWKSLFGFVLFVVGLAVVIASARNDNTILLWFVGTLLLSVGLDWIIDAKIAEAIGTNRGDDLD
jgi:hypothetical protein